MSDLTVEFFSELRSQEGFIVDVQYTYTSASKQRRLYNRYRYLPERDVRTAKHPMLALPFLEALG